MKICNDFGTVLGVTAENRLMTQSCSRPLRLAEAMDKQRAWSLVEDAVTPTGADSIFAAVINAGPEPLVIERVVINVASTEVMKLEVLSSFTPAGGAALTATNRTAGSGNLFATKATWYGAVAITGGGTAAEVHRVKMASGVDKVIDLSKAPIVLGPNMAFQLKAGTGTVATSYSIHGYHAMLPRVNG